MIQAAILQFQKDTQKFPTSWDDLWKSDASRRFVESLDDGKVIGRRTDMIESFRFIAPNTTIRIPVDGSRVAGMMTRPMRPPPDRELRLLIVELVNGTMSMKQYPEEVLRNVFSKAGFDLADYTGSGGNWASESRILPLSGLHEQSPKADLVDVSKETTPSAGRKELHVKANSKVPAKSAPSEDLGVLLIIGIVILLIFVVWRYKKLKSPT